MNSTLEKTFFVEEPIEKVWGYLSDPYKIVTCVPGASLTEKIDEENYTGEVTLKFGPIKAKYNGKILFEEMDHENHKMKLNGKGVDSKGKGSADMIMTGDLSEKDGGTEVVCVMNVAVTGMLAQFGSRLINDVSSSVFDQFVGNFKDKLSGKEVDNSMTASSMIKGLFKKGE